MAQNDFTFDFSLTFDPLEDKMLRIIDNDGNIVSKDLMPVLDDRTITDAYKQMLYERIADEMAISFQRQGGRILHLYA